MEDEVDANFWMPLTQKLEEYRKKDYSDLVFLCIGTDRITGDCYGPLVGYRLQKLLKQIHWHNRIVIGDLESPVNASNMGDKIEYLYKVSPNPYIIAIDAAVSKEKDIGKLVISNDGVKVGKGLQKNLPMVGDASIKAVVAKEYRFPKATFSALQNVSLNLVMNLAEKTADGIYEILKYS